MAYKYEVQIAVPAKVTDVETYVYWLEEVMEADDYDAAEDWSITTRPDLAAFSRSVADGIATIVYGFNTQEAAETHRNALQSVFVSATVLPDYGDIVETTDEDLNAIGNSHA